MADMVGKKRKRSAIDDVVTSGSVDKSGKTFTIAYLNEVQLAISSKKGTAKKMLLQWLREEQFDKVDASIQLYKNEASEQTIDDIITYILKWAVVYCPKISPLSFLVSRKEKLGLFQLLQNDILKSFLLIISGKEFIGENDSAFRSINMEKLSLLLEINEEMVILFMCNPNIKEFLTKSIEQDFSLVFQRKKRNNLVGQKI